MGGSAANLRIYTLIEDDALYCVVNSDVDPNWLRAGNEETGKYRWPLTIRWRTDEADRFLMEGDRMVLLLDTESNEIVAIDYAIQKHVHVINASYRSYWPSTAEQNAVAG